MAATGIGSRAFVAGTAQMPRPRSRTRSRERDLREADLTFEINRLRGYVDRLQQQINELRSELREDLGRLRSAMSELTRRVAALDGGPAPPVPGTPP